MFDVSFLSVIVFQDSISLLDLQFYGHLRVENNLID